MGQVCRAVDGVTGIILVSIPVVNEPSVRGRLAGRVHGASPVGTEINCEKIPSQTLIFAGISRVIGEGRRIMIERNRFGGSDA